MSQPQALSSQLQQDLTSRLADDATGGQLASPVELPTRLHAYYAYTSYLSCESMLSRSMPTSPGKYKHLLHVQSLQHLAIKQ